MKTKKKILAVAIAAIMILIALASASLAYLQDTEYQVNTMTSGKVDIELKEWMRDNNNGFTEYRNPNFFLPAVFYDANGNVIRDDNGDFLWGVNTIYVDDVDNQYSIEYDPSYAMANGYTFKMPDTNRMKNVLDKVITVTNIGKNDAYIRTIILVETNASDKNGTGDTVWKNLAYKSLIDESDDEVNFFEINGKFYCALEFVYTDAIQPNQISAPSVVAFWLNPAVKNDEVPEKFRIYAFAQAVQTNGFNNAQDALDVAFGDVIADNLKTWCAEYITNSTPTNP